MDHSAEVWLWIPNPTGVLERIYSLTLPLHLEGADGLRSLTWIGGVIRPLRRITRSVVGEPRFQYTTPVGPPRRLQPVTCKMQVTDSSRLQSGVVHWRGSGLQRTDTKRQVKGVDKTQAECVGEL